MYTSLVLFVLSEGFESNPARDTMFVRAMQMIALGHGRGDLVPALIAIYNSCVKCDKVIFVTLNPPTRHFFTPGVGRRLI